MLLTLCLGFAATGQTVKVINSSVQSWSGGVAGRSGDNYEFRIIFSGYTKMPLPDTIWIGNEPMPIYIADSGVIEEANTIRYRRKNAVIYEVHTGTQKFEENPNYAHNPLNERYAATARPPINYKGMGLLSYYYDGKHYYYQIPRIMHSLPPISYP